MSNQQLIADGTVSVPQWAVTYKVGTKDEEIGVAVKGYFASSAYLESDDAFMQVGGSKFGWLDLADAQEFCDDKSLMTRTTQEQWDALSESSRQGLAQIELEENK